LITDVGPPDCPITALKAIDREVPLWSRNGMIGAWNNPSSAQKNRCWAR
jgi:hypothetical protein